MQSNDFYQRLSDEFNLDNTPLLASAAMTFGIGYAQYYYALRIQHREGSSPMPFWMHSFYLAHDSAWSYILGSAASRYGGWFLKATSTALLVWSLLEIYCIYHAITKSREETFSSLFGPRPSLAKVQAYAFFLQVAMYCVIFIGILLMGEGCFLQWACLTNVVIVMGPIHEYIRRGSRKGLSLGLCLVNIACPIWTFAPFGMWAQVFPETFTQPVYYTAGFFLFLYSVWAFWIVWSYPPKKASKENPAPIW
ncbi:hypothetical protein F5X68DRAFT_223782 [Plectosphaerella plurivora]|uniref:Uncharacterized protein n=1 Tax=Plectosphaerella plurivora TaxID=936078 RepID=A0A9P9A7V7_9PEZI|nr:hypothetical protein F5X68DRAFT_223782 [Plectosphaerella plurivora]